jgi:hypothetical protein
VVSGPAGKTRTSDSSVARGKQLIKHISSVD